MHGQLIREQMSTAGRLDWIHVANQVRDGDIRSRQLLHVTLFPSEPGDRGGLATLVQEIAGVLGDRGKGIVVDLAARNDRNLLVQQRRKVAENAALRLASEPQQDEVMPGQ